MEGNGRRKSKITLINNDYRDEEPIYLCDTEMEVPKENKTPKAKKTPAVISSESRQGVERKIDVKTSPIKTLGESGKQIGLNSVRSLAESLNQSVGDNVGLSDSWQPRVVLENIEIGNQILVKSKPTSKPKDADTPKTSHKSKKIASKDLDAQTPTTRRSGRMRILSEKARSNEKYRQTKAISTASSSSASEFEVDSDIEKPTALFESKDVEGKDMYGFHTPKKRNALLQKALAVASNSPMSVLQKQTEKISLTPKSAKKFEAIKTPAAVRNKYRKKLETVVREIEDEDFSDFSPSESDFEPCSSSSSESDASEAEVTPKHVRSVRSARKNQKEITYSLRSDEYFSTHASKVFTSDNTLDRLTNPRLTQDKINDILQHVQVNRAHLPIITELSREYEANFEKWMFLMYEGRFSILLYGLGSKRQILEHFRLYLRTEQYPVVFINGFFPSLVIKDVVDVIASDLLRLNDISTNSLEVVDEIESFLENNEDIHVFLIVCNIDGEMLRGAKTQTILSKLAAISNVHLIASIDDINAPLIWDHKKLNRYNFTWWDTTTFLPYVEETSFEGSLLVQKSGTLTLSSLTNIFQSLTTNARGIFNIIIKHHLDNRRDAHYQGISFKDLYWSCREAFLVSSDIALRAQLTEFLDHKLIKSKRNLDGAELLHIPIEGSLLQHFLDHE